MKNQCKSCAKQLEKNKINYCYDCLIKRARLRSEIRETNIHLGPIACSIMVEEAMKNSDLPEFRKVCKKKI